MKDTDPRFNLFPFEQMNAPGSSSEPEWTRTIPNSTICNYFYVIFFVVAAFAGIAVVLDLFVAVNKPKLGLGLLLRSVPSLALAVVNALFLYIICARSLLK